MDAHIEVTRVRKRWQELYNTYTVFIDGSAVAYLRNGKSATLPITPGPHQLQVLYKNNRWRSPTLEFSAREGDLHKFVCGPRNGMVESLYWAWMPDKRDWISLNPAD